MEIVAPLLTFISGIAGMLLFYRPKRRKESATASVAELDANAAQIAHLTKQLKESFVEIDHMQDIIDKKRQEIIELMRKVGELELRLLAAERNRRQAEFNLCTRECPDREPPRPVLPVKPVKDKKDGK